LEYSPGKWRYSLCMYFLTNEDVSSYWSSAEKLDAGDCSLYIAEKNRG
jgi:hypothetical protein